MQGPAVAAPAAGAPSDAQVLLFQVVLPVDQTVDGMELTVNRLGRELSLPLMDDGSDPADVAWDGVWVARAQGAYARYVRAMLVATLGGEASPPLDLGLVRTDDEHLCVVTWRVDPERRSAVRSFVALPGVQHELISSLPLVATFGWLLFLLAWVSAMVRSREPRS